MKRIAQMLDTPIKVQLSPAFADVCLAFQDQAGEPVEVHLDMESTLFVLEHMEDGANAARQLKASTTSPAEADKQAAGLGGLIFGLLFGLMIGGWLL